jgi:hypothetical protein
LDRSGLDCLGPWRFRFENPSFQVLDFLGFPWILSSESSLINGLRWIFAEKFFAALSPWRWSAREGILLSWRAEAQNCSYAKLSFISVFIKDIVILSV